MESEWLFLDLLFQSFHRGSLLNIAGNVFETEEISVTCPADGLGLWKRVVNRRVVNFESVP